MYTAGVLRLEIYFDNILGDRPPCWILIILSSCPCAALTITRFWGHVVVLSPEKMEPGDHMKRQSTIYLTRNTSTCSFRYFVPFIRFQKNSLTHENLRRRRPGRLLYRVFNTGCMRIRRCHLQRKAPGGAVSGYIEPREPLLKRRNNSNPLKPNPPARTLPLHKYAYPDRLCRSDGYGLGPRRGQNHRGRQRRLYARPLQ